MKDQKKFQYKFLQKQLDLCELANGLVNNFESLSWREIRNSVLKLLEGQCVLPWRLRLSITGTAVSQTLQEIGSTGKDLRPGESNTLTAKTVRRTYS